MGCHVGLRDCLTSSGVRLSSRKEGVLVVVQGDVVKVSQEEGKRYGSG